MIRSLFMRTIQVNKLALLWQVMEHCVIALHIDIEQRQLLFLYNRDTITINDIPKNACITSIKRGKLVGYTNSPV
jgi:hypothetical protein